MRINLRNQTDIPPSDTKLEQSSDDLDPVATEDEDNMVELGDEENDTNDLGFETGIETNWKAGDYCVAKWDEDGCWYKAVIEGIEDDTAVVTFTEYGNSAYCNFENILDFDTQIGEDGQLISAAAATTDDVDDEWN